MNRPPAISVIIPLYNKADYVLRAIRSVLRQQPAPAEILVIDDGSTDGGPDLLRSVPDSSRIRLIRQPNAGEGAARNRGLAEMSGDLAAFLDADDEWGPGHLRNLLDLALAYPEAGLFATGYCTVYHRGVRVETAVDADGPALLEDYFETARGRFCAHISSCAVWRSVAREAGGFAEREPLGADLDFFARVALRRPVALHPAVSGVYYAAHPGSAIHTHPWSDRCPPVVRTLRASEARSARSYAEWILAEQALTGLCAGRKREALGLLSGVGSLRCFALRLGGILLPSALLRLFVRLRRSRFALGVGGRSAVACRMVRAHV